MRNEGHPNLFVFLTHDIVCHANKLCRSDNRFVVPDVQPCGWVRTPGAWLRLDAAQRTANCEGLFNAALLEGLFYFLLKI